MLSVSKGTDQPKKRIRTLGKISLLALLMLRCLVKSNLPIKTRLIKRIRITKEIPGVIKNKDRIAIINSLLQVSISFLKRKKKTFSRSSAFISGGKVITISSVLKKRSKKLVSILATSTPVTTTRKKALKKIKTGKIHETRDMDENSGINLVQVPYI